MPGLSTFRRVLGVVDADLLEAVLHVWLAARCGTGSRRSDRGGGFTNASELGGFEEFCEFFDSGASSSVTRAANALISRSRLSSSTSNCSAPGALGAWDTGGTSGTSTCLEGNQSNEHPQHPDPVKKIKPLRRGIHASPPP